MASTLREHTEAEVLAWRSHTPPGEQRIRWAAAVRWTRDLLEVPGAGALSEKLAEDEELDENAESASGELEGSAP